MVFVACSSENLGYQVNGIVGGNAQVSGSFPSTGGSETATATVQGTSNGVPVDNLVTFYNQNPIPPGAGGVAWGVSSDAPQHLNWSPHWEFKNANDTFFTGAPPVCTDGAPYQGSVGDPSLVATGWPNQMAFVTLASSNANFNVDVILTLSNDAGNSFKQLTILSDVNSGGTSHKPDQPKIVMMQSTHVAYVVWGAIDGGGFRSWMRRIHFLGNGSFTLGAPTDMQLGDDWHNLVNLQNIIPVCDPSHQFSDDCTGGTEKIFVGYPTLGGASGYWPRAVGTNPVDCGPNDFDPLTEDIVWQFYYGTPGSWTQLVSLEDQWDPVCVISETIGGIGMNGGANGTPGNQRWTPTMAFDPQTQLFHVLLSMSWYWHHNLGNPPDTPLQEELSPVTSINTSGVTTPCTTIHSDDECFVEQFAPSMAIVTPFNFTTPWGAAAWHDTRGTSNMNAGSGGPGTGAPPQFLDGPVAVVSAAADAMPTTWGAVQNVAVGAGVPFLNTGTNGNTPWGDYECMAADPGSGSLPIAFYPAWGDDRSGSATTQIFTAELTP